MGKRNYRSRFGMFSFILILTAITVAGSGCRLLKHDKAAAAEKKQQAADEKFNAEYDKAVKKHFKNQNKATKKMMKQTQKDAARYNKPRKHGRFSGTKCR